MIPMSQMHLPAPLQVAFDKIMEINSFMLLHLWRASVLGRLLLPNNQQDLYSLCLPALLITGGFLSANTAQTPSGGNMSVIIAMLSLLSPLRGCIFTYPIMYKSVVQIGETSSHLTRTNLIGTNTGQQFSYPSQISRLSKDSSFMLIKSLERHLPQLRYKQWQ